MFTSSQRTRLDASNLPSFASEATDGIDAPSVRPRRAFLLLPVGIFLALLVMLGWGLGRDPSVLPSVLIGKPVPTFTLPPVQGRTLGLSSADLKGEVSLVNVFASWCVACRQEHPVFMGLRRINTVPIHGMNYKDRPQDAEKWLNTMGDPYTRTGADLDGRVSIDWGVYGVPETFVIDAEGRIAFRQVGAVTPEIYREKIGPLIEKLRKQPAREPHEIEGGRSNDAVEAVRKQE
jgi:cytochrome c biogenesis protein CcmG/thiol:disulfide interchange protein DsbE